MLCEECGKRMATLHFTKIINGEKTEYHLCEVCAKEKGEKLTGLDTGFSFQDLLSGLLNPDLVPGQPARNGSSPPDFAVRRAV